MMLCNILMTIILSYLYETVNKQTKKNIPYYKPLIKGLKKIEQEGQLKKNTAVNFKDYTVQGFSNNFIFYLLKHAS